MLVPPTLRDLLPEDRLCELGPGRGDPAIGRRLRALKAEELFDAPVRSPAMAQACLAGLWLLHDFLEESHALSQDVDTVEGSYWHALMHRREPDAGNSKYWFRRVGAHPVLGQLLDESKALGYAYTSPLDFVDFCERVRASGSADEMTARRVQQLEWRLLFEHCYRGASGAQSA